MEKCDNLYFNNWTSYEELFHKTNDEEGSAVFKLNVCKSWW